MGFFSKKKDENRSMQTLSAVSMPIQHDLPEFPELEGEHDNNAPIPQFPNYEPSIANIKNAVSDEDSDEDLDIPTRDNKVMPKVMASNVKNDNSSNVNDDKPLFIKIDKYKDLMGHLKVLKQKLGEAEDVLKSIDETREQEQQKIEDWKKDIQAIKEKLLAIDSKLSEV